MNYFQPPRFLVTQIECKLIIPPAGIGLTCKNKKIHKLNEHYRCVKIPSLLIYEHGLDDSLSFILPKKATNMQKKSLSLSEN